MSKKIGLGHLIAGAAIGVGIGLLIAPQSGKKTRKELKAKCDEFCKNLENIDYEDVKKSLKKKVNELEKELKDLDKEKVLRIAKEKSEDIKIKAEELYKEAVKQGKPIVEKSAKELKEKTISVLKDIIDKLEKDDNTPKVKPLKKEAKTTSKK